MKHTGMDLLQQVSAQERQMSLRLLSQHISQTKHASQARCALALALNALELDSGRLWEGPWRQYTPLQLDVCRGLSVGDEGMLQLACGLRIYVLMLSA